MVESRSKFRGVQAGAEDDLQRGQIVLGSRVTKKFRMMVYPASGDLPAEFVGG